MKIVPMLLLLTSLAACAQAPGVQDQPMISVASSMGVTIEVHITGNGTGGAATANPTVTVPVSGAPGVP